MPYPLPQQRPTALLGVQFVLRCIAVLASLIGVGIAVFVAIKIHKTWGFVFISVSKYINCGSPQATSPFHRPTIPRRRNYRETCTNTRQTLLAFFLDTAEVAALASRRTAKFSLHRVHPFLLIGLDVVTIGLLVWSFFMLIFDKWGKSQAISTVSYTADPFNGIEIWLAVTIGWVFFFCSLKLVTDRYSACHAILLIFDFVDCCSRRSTINKRSANEISLPRSPTNRSYRGGGGVGDVEWG
jgi:hypothetical protein